MGAFDQYHARFDPLLGEQPLLLCDDQWNRARAHSRNADGDLGLSQCRKNIEGDEEQHGNQRSNPILAGHIPPPSSLSAFGKTPVWDRHSFKLPIHTRMGVPASNDSLVPGLIDRTL